MRIVIDDVFSIAYISCFWTSTSRSIYTDDSYTARLYETGVADQAVLILGIVASGQCSLASGTEAVPTSTVLTNTYEISNEDPLLDLYRT